MYGRIYLGTWSQHQSKWIRYQEKSLKGIIAYRHIFPKVLELMEQGYFSAEKLVTKKIKLENIVEEGFVELTQDKAQIKILVEP